MCQFTDPNAPQPGGPTLADNICGFYAPYGVLGAIYAREKTGKGCRIETSMLEATAAFARDAFVNYRRHDADIGPLSRVRISQSYVFQCQDGRCVAIHLSSRTKFWEGLLAALDRPDLAAHSDFAARGSRIGNCEKLRDELAMTCLTRSRSEWMSRLEAADVRYAPVYSIPEVFDDPQIMHLGTFYSVQHPSEGEVWGIQPPLLSDGQRPGDITPPPVVGQDTDAILSELGRDTEAVAALRDPKVV